jgi:hypothetical protein
MQVTVGKVLGFLIAVAYAVILCLHEGAAALKYCPGLLLPLAFIWFPEEIGSVTGYFRSGYVNTQTPGIMITIMGWFFLVGLPVLLFFVLK